MTQVVYGEKGTGENISYQAPFKSSVQCDHCGQDGAVLTVSVSEAHPEFACNMHENDPQGEGFWYHDAAAWALYTCRKCFKVTVVWNQA